MTSKERLEQYIKEDSIYQEYLENHKSYVSDFDKFCIEHCQDIKNILEENVELKKQLENISEELEIVRCDLHNRTSERNGYERELEEYKKQQKEFVEYLEENIDEIHFRGILSKYKEIINYE